MRSRRWVTPWVVALFASVILGAPVVAAGEPSDEDRIVARTLFDYARHLLAEQRFEEACAKLEDSLKLVRGPGTLFNLAQCYEHTGRLASSWRHYGEVASVMQGTGDTKREEAARERASALEPRLSTLRIDVAEPVAGLRITRNGDAVAEESWNIPVPIDPGSYEVEASAPGHLPRRQKVEVTADAHAAVLAMSALEPEPPPQPSPPPEVVDVPPETEGGDSGLLLAGWIIGGVGVAAVVAATVVLIVGNGNVAVAEKNCPDRKHCSDSEAADLGNQGTAMQAASGGLFGTGGAAIVTGTILLMTGYLADDGDAQPEAWSFRPMVGARGAALGLELHW